MPNHKQIKSTTAGDKVGTYRRTKRVTLSVTYSMGSARSAWESHRNNVQTGINWQFSTENARVKLRRLYTKFED